jgi:hypothetical protein
MKFYLKLTLLFLFPFCGFAQSFKKAKELALKNNQAILLIIEVPLPPNLIGPAPNKAFKDEVVVKKLEANFIVVETNRGDTAIRSIVAKTNRYPAFVFLHPNGDIFHNDFGYGAKEKYLAMLDKALLLRKEKSVTQLQNEYEKHPDNFTLLKDLINARRKSGIIDNAELIDKYVTGLKVADFNDYQTVLFILQAGPYSDGNAYKFAYTNRKIVDSIYKTEPSQTRLDLNNAIIVNTMARAIKTRNRIHAQNGANYARSTWGKDYVKGNKIFNTHMIRFYSAIKDSTNYFRTAIQHYDTYYMNISLDSLKRMQARERVDVMQRIKLAESRKAMTKERLDSLIKADDTGNKIRTVETAMVPSSAFAVSTYSNDLNNIAYQFYQTGTKNLNHLTKAMIWSKRAVDLSSQPSYYDTLAHIYYAMGIHAEALATQKIAMDLAKRNKDLASLSQMTEAYEKMKAKTL